MSRQVLNAVFPFIKSAWNLSDTKLGSLSSVVALMVGMLTFPLSVLADRWGRVKSIALMAALWSLATLGCAISTTYGEMLFARACVGIGEAAYGSVGIALVLSSFPRTLEEAVFHEVRRLRLRGQRYASARPGGRMVLDAELPESLLRHGTW